MEDLKWWQHIYRSIRYGDLYAGYDSPKKYPTAPKFGFYSAYYDGENWCFHCFGFYVGGWGYY